jgi:hypothetical protein
MMTIVIIGIGLTQPVVRQTVIIGIIGLISKSWSGVGPRSDARCRRLGSLRPIPSSLPSCTLRRRCARMAEHARCRRLGSSASMSLGPHAKLKGRQRARARTRASDQTVARTHAARARARTTDQTVARTHAYPPLVGPTMDSVLLPADYV